MSSVVQLSWQGRGSLSLQNVLYSVLFCSYSTVFLPIIIKYQINNLNLGKYNLNFYLPSTILILLVYSKMKGYVGNQRDGSRGVSDQGGRIVRVG